MEFVFFQVKFQTLNSFCASRCFGWFLVVCLGWHRLKNGQILAFTSGQNN